MNAKINKLINKLWSVNFKKYLNKFINIDAIPVLFIVYEFVFINLLIF